MAHVRCKNADHPKYTHSTTLNFFYFETSSTCIFVRSACLQLCLCIYSRLHKANIIFTFALIYLFANHRYMRSEFGLRIACNIGMRLFFFYSVKLCVEPQKYCVNDSRHEHIFFIVFCLPI